MSSTTNPYLLAYEREKKARHQAEQLLESKSRELYQKNKQLEKNYRQLAEHQALMLKTEKLATLGTLSAGVAHEINNPLAFVSSNIETLQTYQKSYNELYLFCQTILNKLPADESSALTDLLKEQDLAYIQDDIFSLMSDTIDGLNRVRDIVSNLRQFSRTQHSDHCEADITEGLRSTLKLLSSELKNNVSLSLDLHDIPRITCNPNELNQVFLNLIINAKHATNGIENPTISISTHTNTGKSVITIADNGCGIPEEHLEDIFLPFYTTKPVGEGTGMGLAIAHSIIENHGGTLSVSSTVNKGTSFTIELPTP